MVLRSFIPLAVTDHDLVLREIDILHPQPHALHQTQPTAVQKMCHQFVVEQDKLLIKCVVRIK